MLIPIPLVTSLLCAISVSIVEPTDGDIYNGDWLPLRAIVENDDVIPDSVIYMLNGSSSNQISRLNTDWNTYMSNEFHHGYSESPAPHDNSILWTADVTGDYHEFASPVIANGIVYQPSNLGTDSLYALDAATGELIWRYCIGDNDDAVTVKDGRLYVSGDSLWCLDAATGARVWGSPHATLFGGTPVLFDSKVFCGYSDAAESWNSIVCCLSAEDGSPIWLKSLPGCLGSCMLCWDDLLYVPVRILSGGGCLFALDATTGEIVWENTDSPTGFWDSSPVLAGTAVYINAMDRSAYAIDAASGVTLWSKLLAEGYAITATPAYWDNRLFFADQFDSFYCLEASSGDVLWTVPGTQHGSSAVADGLVFYGEKYNPDNARIVALSCETGEETWSCSTGATGIRSSPAITDGVMYVAGEDWKLYAFGTGLKYTYREDYFYADVGVNELIVTSWDNGAAVAADSISFMVTQTGITFESSRQFDLCAEPNPMQTAANITFNLGESGLVSLRIFDLSGRIVASLANQELFSGAHSIQWNGCSDTGQPLSSGLYLCRIQHDGVVETTGLCVLR